MEVLNEIEEGNQFTDEELAIISESLANCIDFGPVVDEIKDGEAGFAALTDCVADASSIDAVEADLLFEVLGDNGDRVLSPILVEGFTSCPDLARDAVVEQIFEQVSSRDHPVLEVCVADLSNDELLPYVESVPFEELISVLEACIERTDA